MNGTRQPRRRFLATLPSIAAAGSAWLSVGLWISLGLKFALPPVAPRRAFMVGLLSEFHPGSSRLVRLPSGQQLNIRRLPTAAPQFVALSRSCPHLGCRLRWEPESERFLCPCHAGSFDRRGQPLSGPPKDADQAMHRYALRERAGRLYLLLDPDAVPIARVCGGQGAG